MVTRDQIKFLRRVAKTENWSADDAVLALCDLAEAALAAREALSLALDFAPIPEAPIRNLLAHLPSAGQSPEEAEGFDAPVDWRAVTDAVRRAKGSGHIGYDPDNPDVRTDFCNRDD